MEMFREIPPSSEARQVLSEEEMNRLLQKERDRMDGLYFEGMGLQDYLEMVDKEEAQRRYQDVIGKIIESTPGFPIVDALTRRKQKAREPIKIYAEGGMVGTNQPRQMEGIASVLADQGRYGDSMLVHMNPAEVQGLASLSPTGSLTVNPQTGQPEAFLGMILGALGSLGAGTGVLGGTLAALGPGLAGAIGSGLGTFIETGDLKKGLLGGLTGYGIGKFVGGLGGSGAKAVESIKSVADATPQAFAESVSMAKDAAMNAPTLGENISSIASNVSQNPEVLLEAATATGAAIPAAVGLGGRAAIEAEEAMARGVGADAEARKAM